MKKILYLVALMATLIPALSFAAPIRVEKELGWKSRRPSRFELPANEVDYIPRALASLDTAGLGDNGVDTTGVFTMSDMVIAGGGFPNGNGVSSTGGFSANDSLLVAYLVVYRDSTAAGTTNLTGVTATFQASGDGNSWGSASGWGATATTGDPTVTIPIIFTPSVAAHYNLFAKRLRVYFATVNGQMPACRVKLVYWADDGRR